MKKETEENILSSLQNEKDLEERRITFSARLISCLEGKKKSFNKKNKSKIKIEQLKEVYVKGVCSDNQDLNSVKLKDENKLCIGEGGAGKDPEVARKLLEEKKEDVIDFMRYSFGDSFDRIFICAGGGGGSGSGMVTSLVHLAKEVQELTRTTEKKVGVILTLPKNSEGAKVNANAATALRNVYALVKEGSVSPLIILDHI